MENAAPEDQELLSAMEELERARQRVAQLRQLNRDKAITDIIEKIKMYDLKPEELGFAKGHAPKSARKSGLDHPVPSTLPAVGAPSATEMHGVDGRSQVKPKYASPDGKETWSGRGKAPLWMKALLDAGHQKEEFEVSKSNSGSAE